jgi:hypothetical protein
MSLRIGPELKLLWPLVQGSIGWTGSTTIELFTLNRLYLTANKQSNINKIKMLICVLRAHVKELTLNICFGGHYFFG